LVEVNPRVQAGAPALGGTRMPVDAIADNFEYGVDVAEIAEQFELPAEPVQAIVTYAQIHRVARSLRQERPDRANEWEVAKIPL
jgi:uncharacterized protein (DUF433 family)